mmetsp:Transcript_24293/g.76457  ORF Transcript_24293/g.76457 Transcript_24293/m.76457 type:complete len:388 (-) Transcript_24293:519-1682(-)
MQVAGHPAAAVDVLADALKARGVLEVGGADGLAHDVPRGPAAHQLDLLRLHDVHELRAHLPRLAHALDVDEVVAAPVPAVPVVLPLVVRVQEGEVVALGHEELLARGVGLVRAVLGAEEHARHAQHAHDGQHLVGAPELLAHDEHLGQGGVQGELHHLVPHGRERARVVERAQNPELVHAVEDVVLRRRVHEVELQQVLDAQGLEQQHHVAEVGALDLRHRVLQHLVPVLPLREEPVALPGPGAPRAPRALVHGGARAGEHLQGVHAHLGVVHLELRVARVHHIEDPVHREGGLGDVGGDDALAAAVRGLLEDDGLQVAGQLAVHGQNQHLGRALAQVVDALLEGEARGLDLLLPRHEDQNVPGGVAEVDGHGLLARGVDVVLAHRL